MMILPKVLLLFRIVLAVLVFLGSCCHMKLKTTFSIYMNCVGILTGIAWNLYSACGKMAIFTILTLLIHEHLKSFHLLMSSISAFSVLKLLLYKPFTWLEWVIPRFWLRLPRIFSVIIFSVCLLFIYRKAIDFC